MSVYTIFLKFREILSFVMKYNDPISLDVIVDVNLNMTCRFLSRFLPK